MQICAKGLQQLPIPNTRYAAANNLTVLGGSKDDKERISEILQETWESADDWFIS